MPSNLVGKGKRYSEKSWGQAKDLASESYDKDDPAYWAVVNKITKNIQGARGRKGRSESKHQKDIEKESSFFVQNILDKLAALIHSTSPWSRGLKPDTRGWLAQLARSERASGTQFPFSQSPEIHGPARVGPGGTATLPPKDPSIPLTPVTRPRLTPQKTKTGADHFWEGFKSVLSAQTDNNIKNLLKNSLLQ